MREERSELQTERSYHDNPEIHVERIEETKDSLARNLTQLEGTFRSVVSDTRETIDTNLDRVRGIIDPRDHIRRRPGLAFLLAVGCGIILAARSARKG